MTPEQVKASVVAKVTGNYGEMSVLEAAENPNHPSHAQPSRGPDIWDIAPPAPAQSARPFLSRDGSDIVFEEPAPEKAVHTAELEEALESYKLGFSNVLVYRAFKALEARLAVLEGRL
jgi:hypothetical protein